MSSLFAIYVTVKTIIINNITLGNVIYLLNFAYSKTLKTEKEMGNKETVLVCPYCGGNTCPVSEDGLFFCHNKRNLFNSKSSKESEELWLNDTNDNTSASDRMSLHEGKPRKYRFFDVFFMEDGTTVSHMKEYQNQEKCLNSISITFRVEVSECIYKLYICLNSAKDNGYFALVSILNMCGIKELELYGTQRDINLDKIMLSETDEDLEYYRKNGFNLLNKDSKFETGETYTLLCEKEYTKELKTVLYPSLVKKGALIIQKTCRKFIFRCRLIKRINAKIVTRLKNDVERLVERLAEENNRLKEFEGKCIKLNIRNGELRFELNKANDRLKAQSEIHAYAGATKPENKARNWALAFYTIVSKVLWCIVLFFVYLPANVIGFIMQLPANTKYLATGVWSGEITFRTTVDGCITCIIFEPLNTFCFVMTILALIYLRK